MAKSPLKQFTENIEGIPAFNWYIKKTFHKQSGNIKKRVIWVPNDAAREVQNRFLDYLKATLNYSQFSDQLYGTMPNRSNIDNALSHRENRFFYLLDLENAYPSIAVDMATHTLCTAHYDGFRGQEDEVRDFLTRYCFLSKDMIQACRDQGITINPTGLMTNEIDGLITGGPVAPLLFDLTLTVMTDLSLNFTLNNYFNGETDQWHYTRYMDDLTLSCKSHRIADDPDLRHTFRQIIYDAGFGISHHKSKLLDIRKGAIPITGVNLVLGPKGVYCKLPRGYLEKLRHFFYKAAETDSNITLQQVGGTWGAFYACLRHRHTPISALEKEIIINYRACRRKFRTRENEKY